MFRHKHDVKNHGIAKVEMPTLRTPLGSTSLRAAEMSVLREAVEKEGVFSMSKVLEGLEGEFLLIFLHDTSVFQPEHFSIEWIDEERGIQVMLGLLPQASERTPVILFFSRAKKWTWSKAMDWLEEYPAYLPEKIKEALAKHWTAKTILKLLRNPKPFLPEFFQTRTLDKAAGIHSVSGFTADSSVSQVVAVIFNGKAWTKEKADEWLASRQGKAYRRER